MDNSDRTRLLDVTADLSSKANLLEFRMNSTEKQIHHELEALKRRIHELEMHQAKQIGQDKIIGFVAGAFILSLISILVPFFLQPDNFKQKEIDVSYSIDSARIEQVSQE